MLAVATLLSLRETGWLLILLGVILLALSMLCVAPIISGKVRQHGFFKTVIFFVSSAFASWAGGKGGRGQNDNAKCKIDNEDGRVELRTGSGNNPRSVSIPVLPDAADVGEAEGFGEMPVVTNLDICGIARWTNATELVFGWTPSTRPVNDLAWIYAGTTLPVFEKMLPVDVSGCVSNALISVYDSDIADTNVLDKAFYSVGDEKDADDDGVSDADERFVYRTNSADPDTDGDGINDGDEILLGTSPLSTDTDADGIDDGDESGWISRYDGFEWYDSTGWDTEYGSDSLAPGAFPFPVIPLLTSQLSPSVPFYDFSLLYAVAYQSGYGYKAPQDTSGEPARIMQRWIESRNECGDVDGWMKANDCMSGHNACAIERLNQDLVRYKWFRRIDHTAFGYHIFNTYKVNTEEVEAPR